MSKLKKGAMFSDIHWGRKNGSEEHNQDCMRFIDWFCEQVKADPSIDHIQFLGDWHEHRASIGVNTLMYSYEGAKKLNDLGLPVFFASGNHDHFLRNSSDIFSTYHFNSFENFRVMNKVTVLDEIHGSVLFVPFILESEYPQLIEHKNIPVVSGHLELKGFRVSGSHNIMEHGPDAETFFKKQKRVFSGHFHARQNKGNIFYIGNPFPMDFSDANDSERGMAVYDFVTDELNYIDWPDGPQYITATLSDVLENPKKILKKGARVKIEVDDDITYEESNKIKEKLASKYHLRDITLMEKMTIDVQLTDEEEAIEELQLETTNEVIQTLIGRIKDDSVDTDLLLKIYNSAKLSSGTDLSKAAHVEFMDMTMRNFLSYGNNVSSVNLNFAKPTMVMGRNYDSVVEGQIDSNGAGKSTILNALLLCLYGENLIKSKLDKQINRANGKNMMLTVTFKADGKYYKVERYRKNREAGGDGVRLYVNDKEPIFTKEHDKTPDSVSNCEAEIARIIGIPYEMFIRIVVFSATHQPFLSLPSSHASQANQRDIIEELFGLTELTQKAEVIKAMLSAFKIEFKNLVEIDARLQMEAERHNSQLETNITRQIEWETSQAKRIEDIQNQIDVLTQVDLYHSIEGFQELDKLTKELNKVEKNIPVLETELRNVQSSDQKRRAWDIRCLNEIITLTSKVEELQAYDFNLLRETRDKLNTLKKVLSIKEIEYSSWKTSLDQINQTIADLEKGRKKVQDEIMHLSDNQCPFCLQQFAEAKNKIISCTHSVLEFDSKIKDNQRELSGWTIKIDKILEEINQLNDEIANLKKVHVPDDIDQLSANLQTYSQQLIDLNESINPHIVDEEALTENDILESINDIKKKATTIKNKMEMAKEFINSAFKSMADIEGHKIKIQNLKDRVQEMNAEVNPFISVVKSLQDVELEPSKMNRINELDKEIKHQEFLIKLLTKKDSFIRKALLNKCLPLLNTRLRYYLDRVGLPHKVFFNEEMGVDISQFGSDFEYDLFSSGQKARVNICLAFAFRDVLQSRFGKTNLCILDECLDTGLGAVGVSLVAKMIKSIALDNKLSMFVISHRDEISSMFDKRLEIELRNGFSTIMDDYEQ